MGTAKSLSQCFQFRGLKFSSRIRSDYMMQVKESQFSCRTGWTGKLHLTKGRTVNILGVAGHTMCSLMFFLPAPSFKKEQLIFQHASHKQSGCLPNQASLQTADTEGKQFLNTNSPLKSPSLSFNFK